MPLHHICADNVDGRVVVGCTSCKTRRAFIERPAAAAAAAAHVVGWQIKRLSMTHFYLSAQMFLPLRLPSVCPAMKERESVVEEEKDE